MAAPSRVTQESDSVRMYARSELMSLPRTDHKAFLDPRAKVVGSTALSTSRSSTG
jgi:hypothetical protein